MRRALRRLPARVLAGLLATALAGAAVTAGWSFVVCAPMAEARMHCCCPPASRATDVIARTCCEDRSVPSLPGVDTHESTPKTFAAPLLAVLPLALLLGGFEASAAEQAPRGVEARAGPGERLHATHSVFLL
ncbi:MAG: hypothetical protein M3Y87_18715 [Myxococcota bacterium]|nr:hypothetical protein [Myxococcota bacterium]